MFDLLADERSTPHRWSVARAFADPGSPVDPTVIAAAEELRLAYGEGRLLERVEELIDSGVAIAFDLESILAGLRGGLPDPTAEQGKPAALRNSRSEPAEMVARLVLRQIAGVRFPVSPQLTKGNPNQPVLGFDAWGLTMEGDAATLVLVQVKATDDPARPPSPSAELLAECLRVKDQRPEILRALCAIAAVGGFEEDLLVGVVRLIEACGQQRPVNVCISPVIVRGQIAPDLRDLLQLRQSGPPDATHGVSVGVGAPLSDFGEAVLRHARGA